MTDHSPPVPGSKRVQNHRKRNSLNKLKRVEVKVSEKDVWLIRSVAELLKSDEEKANSIRNDLSELLFPGSEQSLVDFFKIFPEAAFDSLLLGNMYIAGWLIKTPSFRSLICFVHGLAVV